MTGQPPNVISFWIPTLVCGASAFSPYAERVLKPALPTLQEVYNPWTIYKTIHLTNTQPVKKEA